MTPETLRTRRAALGMSQQALHDALCDAMETPRKDYGRQVVSMWENGKRPVPHWMGVLLNNIEEAREPESRFPTPQEVAARFMSGAAERHGWPKPTEAHNART